MNEEAFVKKREPDWQRLTALCDKADASPALLSATELHEFIRTYRRVSSDLARARTESSNIQLIEFLNDLCTRAYSQLYRTPAQPLRKSLASAVLIAAQTVRRCRWLVAASFGIFLFGAIFASSILSLRPDMRSHVIPPDYEATFDHWKSGEGVDRTAGESVLMTAFYATNNPRVSIVAGAAAASTFGIGTAYLLYTNGMILGALSHEMASVNKLGFLYASVLPHGVTEISGILMAGAGGLAMGWALINPGRRRRGEALLAAGKDSAVLLGIGVVQTLLAAPVEGFFSFNPQVPSAFKVAFAAATLVAWLAFWIGYGRDRDPIPTSASEPSPA